MRDGRWSRIARYISFVVESEMGVRVNPGSLLIACPNFGSATAREPFFSSLRESRSLASMGETFPSTRAATSSSAVAALSNFSKCFNLSLQCKIKVRNRSQSFKNSIATQLYLQSIDTLCSFGFSRVIRFLQNFLVRLEQGETCTVKR